MQRETAYDEVFDAQEHYRLLLDAMARPGTINVLPRMSLTTPPAITSAAALVGFALLNADVSFYADGEAADIVTRYLVVNTAATPESPGNADFVFAQGTASAALVADMKKGTLPYPDEGATLVASVEALASEAQGLGGKPYLALTLEGPGIKEKRTFFVSGLGSELIAGLQACNQEFPSGVDLILTDPGHRIACIPRSSRVEWSMPTSF
jgi:alpha-D-ribose 1-methylphosphonate 5-triphosphate synthase subunit PhnH